MTTIRRITVSQIDGGDANNTDTNEIRPFGETAFYLDTSGEGQKLTLMMFDGTRTHQKSKVLSPGVLFGSNADSGDGGGYDTIKLIPDASLGTDQYLIIDPTSPGHIHIRAGGTIDNSNADLYLGGENSFVKIPNGANPDVVITANSNTWTFNTSGTLVLPDTTIVSQGFISGGIGNHTAGISNFTGTNQVYVQDTDVGIQTSADGVTFKTWTFDQYGALTPPSGFNINHDGMSIGNEGTYVYITIPDNANAHTYDDGLRLGNNDGPISLSAGLQGGNTHHWKFNTNGGIDLPGGSSIATNNEDVAIVAGNDGAGTFGSVTINTQSPPAVYTIVQQTGPFSLDTITTDGTTTPNIASIVPGMLVTGSGITAITTVTNVSGPDIYDTYIITISPPSDTGLNYNETYTFTAGSVTDKNWEFNSLGELYLPRGGVIQETDVTNELWGTTTTSLTLVPGGAANGQQRLEIYSTGGGEGNHIHITSGDQTQTDLFIGNDTQYFAVSSAGTNYIQARPGIDSPSPGMGASSGGSINIYAGNAGDNGGNVNDGASGGDIFIQAGIATAGTGGDVYIQSSSGPDGFGSILLGTSGGSNNWEFDRNNNLTIPSGGDITFDSSATSYIYGVSGIEFANATIQTTAYTGIAAQGTTSTSAAVGYIGMPQNNQTSNYTVNITDQGKHIYCTGTSFIVTIPANTVTSFPIGSSVAFIAGPTTTATIAIQTDTMYLGGSTGTSGTRTLSPFGMATAVKVNPTIWFISGAGLA